MHCRSVPARRKRRASGSKAGGDGAWCTPCGAARGKNLHRGAGKGEGTMAFWLMKSEPGSYGWADLVRDGGTEWDGVRNPAARLHLKAMAVGDEAFFYHSGADKAAVGVMRIARTAAPDRADADWVSVRVEPVRGLPR